MSPSRITLIPARAGRAPAALLLGISLLHSGALFAADPAPREDADWWREPQRMIQTNLREIGARMRDIYSFHQANERWLLDTVELVFLNGDLRAPEMAPDAERWLRFIPAAMSGPPEKCYYTNVSEIPALYRRTSGKGSVAWFPWSVGAHYDRQGHPGCPLVAAAPMNHDCVIRLEPGLGQTNSVAALRPDVVRKVERILTSARADSGH